MATGIRSRYGLLPFSRPNPTVSLSGKRTFHPPMKSRTTSVYYIQFSNDEQITDNQHTVRSTHDKLRTLRPGRAGELPRGRSARPRNRAPRSRIGRARSCQRESHGPRPRGKGARSCRRNRVYERTGSAYRFRAADRRARPVPRRDRDKRPDSGSARRRGRRSGARQRHRFVRGQETLGRSGRIPGRDPFHHLVEGNRRRRLRATHPLGIHAGGNRFPASRKADRRPNHHADRIRASPAGIRKRQDGLRCARKQIVGQGNPRHGPHRRLHQEPVGRRRRLRHGRPIACNRFAKPQARTESGSVAEIRGQTACRDERQFRNALRRPRLLARRDGRTAAVGR